jgi:soluble lytic murein transglycosylase
VSNPFALQPDALALASMNAISVDAPAIKQVIEFVRQRKISQAIQIERQVRDPMAQKLIEWIILRSEDSGADFDRYRAFLQDNPAWPSLGRSSRAQNSGSTEG